MHQAANGSFPPQEAVTSIIGVEHKLVLDAGKALGSDTISANVWMTTVVVAFLTEKCKDEKDVWELVVEKAMKWLQNSGVELVSDHAEKAREFILKSVR
jgi:hypothetical protein